MIWLEAFVSGRCADGKTTYQANVVTMASEMTATANSCRSGRRRNRHGGSGGATLAEASGCVAQRQRAAAAAAAVAVAVVAVKW